MAKHPPLIIRGAVWRQLRRSDRVIPITLPVINFRDETPIQPTITVVVKERPRGRHKKAALS